MGMFPYSQPEFKIPSDWEYRGEGNCNVVIALPSQRKILRIRKVKKITSIFVWLISWLTDFFHWYYQRSTINEIRDFKFYQRIIRPLFGNKFVCDAQPVFLSKKQLGRLEKKLENKRPEHRKHKQLEYGRAALFDDYTFIKEDSELSQDCFSVEIKPKQGWIPFSERNYPKCIYCLNQYLKKEEGDIQSISSYCPLDLFSGVEEKMCKAIKALLYNPQNNLKLFRNGKYCYGQNCDLATLLDYLLDLFECGTVENLIDEFVCLLQKSLVTIVDGDPPKCDKNLFCHWNKIIQTNHTKLPRGCVLDKILSVQMLDMEGIQYYHKLLSGNNKTSEYGYVYKLLKRVDIDECMKCFLMKAKGELETVPYLISAIAKDCSLMITFKRTSKPSREADQLHIQSKSSNFIMNIGIFDLYPKPISTIEKHWKKRNKMLNMCI